MNNILQNIFGLKESIELINSLAESLSSLETDTDTVTLDNKEIIIDKKLFFVTGDIYYSSNYDAGNYWIEPSFERELLSAELSVLFYDESNDEDVSLSGSEIEKIYKKLY